MCIQVATLAIQVIGVIGLFWYVIETMKIRTTGQKQLQTSLDLIKAATAQVEGMSKPCISFWGELRDGNDVILEMHGAVGNIVAQSDQGSYVIQNIGNGVALNIKYTFTRPNREPNERYVPNLLPTGKATLVEGLNAYNEEHTATFDYESIGGHKYRSRITLNQRVITSFQFEEIAA
jgi:hypothetical protein